MASNGNGNDKVVFAEQDVTVHIAHGEPQKGSLGQDVYDVHSEILVPGDTRPLSALPKYLQEAVEQGRAEGLSLKTEDEARSTSEEVARVRALVAAQRSTTSLSSQDAGHSDYLVPDAVKLANLRAQGAAEPPSGELPAPGAADEEGVGASGVGDVPAGLSASTGSTASTEGTESTDDTALEQEGDAKDQPDFVHEGLAKPTAANTGSGSGGAGKQEGDKGANQK